MRIEKYYFSKIQIITLSVLIIGMVVGLILVQREQIIKTRASVSDSFRVYENDEIQGPRLVAFQGTYPIENFDVTIESTSFENRPTDLIKAKVSPPPARAIPATDLNLNLSKLPPNYQQWAMEILNSSTPKFQSLISAKPTVVITDSRSFTDQSTGTVHIKTNYSQDFFKQVFIHELGHRIMGGAGTPSPRCGGRSIEQAVAAEGYLTYYSQHATPANVTTSMCGSTNQSTQYAEDFAESASYYINQGIGELNYGSGCSINAQGNPFRRGFPAHKAYMDCLLGP